MKKMIVFVVALFLGSTVALAASTCSYTEQADLNSKAANVKASYEILTEKGQNEIGENYVNEESEISIMNVTSDMYVIVTDEYGNAKTYNSADATDGIIKFKGGNLEKVVNYTIDVYSSDKTHCANEKYRTMYLTIPRYNILSEKNVCDEDTDFYLCKKYVTFDEVEDDVFYEKYKEYKNTNKDDTPSEKEVKNNNAFIDFINNNKWYIVGGLVILVGLGSGFAYYKNKKDREL